MITITLFSLMIFSGSLISYMFNERKIMRLVPVTLMSMSLLLFLFGLVEQLKLGVVFLNVFAFAAYAICGYKICRSDNSFDKLKELGKKFLVVILFVFAICYLDRGMLPHEWDEFSHWADVVKAMFYIDDFATNSLSQSLYKSYPPAMGLIQYLFLEENALITGIKDYADWRVFAAWHIATLSLLFPLFDSGRAKKVEMASIGFSVLAICCFYFDFLDTVYIDPAVSVVTAYVVCLILFSGTKDAIYDISIILGCIFLALLKDVGLYFACFGGVIYFCDKLDRPIISKRRFLSTLPFLASLLVTKLWSLELKKEAFTPIYHEKIDFAEYLQLLVLKRGDSYKQSVVNSSLVAFTEKRFHIGPLFFSYCEILLFLSIAVIITVLVVSRIGDRGIGRLRLLLIFFSTALMTVLYALFIGAMYVYRFPEILSNGLASYDRYMNMCFLFFTIIAVGVILFCLFQVDAWPSAVYGIALVFLILFGTQGITDFLSRKTINEGIEFKKWYSDMIETINENCEPSDKVCFLSRGDKGLDRLVVRYYCRPILFDFNLGFSLGGPCFEGDEYYTDISPEDFMNSLIHDKVSHVAVFRVTDEFAENYGKLFADRNDIEPISLFTVDVSKRKLVRCD